MTAVYGFLEEYDGSRAIFNTVTQTEIQSTENAASALEDSWVEFSELPLLWRPYLDEGRWYRFDISNDSDHEVNLQANLRHSLDAEQSESIWASHPERIDYRTTEGKWLISKFSLTNLRTPNFYEIEEAVDESLRSKVADSLICYNVGQGSCAALCSKGEPVLYFDFGRGFGRNAKTYPTNFKPRLKNNPLIVLSHWHMDHWLLGDKFPQSQEMVWIVPLQKIGPMAFKFASKVNANKNGKLLIWSKSLAPLGTPIGDFYKLPSHNHRNQSGIVLIAKIHHHNHTSVALLPGDAAYNRIPHQGRRFDGLIATHHGGKWYPKDIPPTPNKHGGVLAISLGKNNSHGHPAHNTLHKYQQSKWTSPKTTDCFGDIRVL